MKRNYHHQKWFRIWVGFAAVFTFTAPWSVSAAIATQTSLAEHLTNNEHQNLPSIEGNGLSKVDVFERSPPLIGFPMGLLVSLSGVHERVLSYPFKQVWPTTIRYLRVNRHYKLNDHDKKSGFILFNYPIESEIDGEGSIELIKIVDAAQRPSVKIIIRMSHGPHHLAFSIAKGISDKIRNERGQPAPPPAKKTPAPVPPEEPPNKKPGHPPSSKPDDTEKHSSL